MRDVDALIGRTIAARFRLTEFIGEGAMACVFRGEQAEEPREVAIKIMHPHLLTDRTFVGRFRREAKAAAQIDHPASVRILDTGVDGTLLYIAMEMLSGHDLFDVLAAEKRLSEARACDILVQVCAALSAAHAHGIVHRDLKPENIMLLEGGDAGRDRVKVLDFGIAKILERDLPTSTDDQPISMSSFSVTALTSAGVVVGTPAYMSPEQCRGEPIDERSDIYACGVLLYQLVTGRLPFPGTTAMDFAVMHVRTPPTPPRDHVPGLYPGLEALLLCALDKFPAMRPQSAAELGAALTRLLPELAREPHRDGAPVVGALRLESEGTTRSDTNEPSTRRLGDDDDGPDDDALRTAQVVRADGTTPGTDAFSTLVAPMHPSVEGPLSHALPRSARVVVDADAGADTPTRAQFNPADLVPQHVRDDVLAPAGAPVIAAPAPLVVPAAPVAAAAPPAPRAPISVARPSARGARMSELLASAVWALPLALAFGVALGTLLFYLFR
jgi:serine/threonine-protein kinase